MAEINIVLFLVVVTVGAAVQTLTGFAMGLIIMVCVALLSIADIAFAAAVVSFISLVNALVALRKGHRFIDWRFAGFMIAGLVPAMVIGLYLLSYLSAHNDEMLRLLLGVVVIVAGTSLMIAPTPFQQRSGKLTTVVTGFFGGLLAGLYSAGGAPMAYFAYRQPVSIDTIRFTLLATFAISTVVRVAMILIAGQLTLSVVSVSLIAIPFVVVTTLVVSQFMQRLPDKAIRMLVFVVLILAGGSLIVSSLAAAAAFHP